MRQKPWRDGVLDAARACGELKYAERQILARWVVAPGLGQVRPWGVFSGQDYYHSASSSPGGGRQEAAVHDESEEPIASAVPMKPT